MALYFSGSAGNYAEITGGYGNTLSNTAGMISFWIKPIYDYGVAIATKGSSTGALFCQTNNAAGRLFLGINDNFPTYNDARFLADTWTFVCIGGNNTTNLEAGLAYVNGELSKYYAASTAKWSTTAANLYLGRYDLTTLPYKGWIGDIRAWNRRLTPTEVLAVYNNQSVTSGLVERWPLTESSGSTITGTVGGNNGTITGTPTWGGPEIPYGTPSGSSRPSSPFLSQVIG